MTKLPQKIGFLGAGKMASALAQGLLGAGLCAADQLLAGDVSEAARAQFQKATGIRAVATNREVAAFCDTAILAVKPQAVAAVLDEIRPAFAGRLLISIAAGVTTTALESSLGDGGRVVRVMPNTPALVRCGASAYAAGQHATDADLALAQSIFSAVGLAVCVPEKMLDAVTGLSGSGPAYVFLMIEALSDGGVEMGLPRDVALKLAAQTVLGAARLAMETGRHPGELKDMVTSPGGTTIEGLRVLEESGVRGALMGAVRAATQKSMRLGGRQPA